ncbi:glycerol-3-phosphate O-acyltransferase [Fistulina hepatica ATCC 64428]|nr:glycerol-3-phosphate O-acyltransferase [Fistulina hepatica ATCC 64428]
MVDVKKSYQSEPSTVTYEVAIFFWRIVISLFFREIRPRGGWNIPRDGPVIFVGAPHHNQFLDPLLLALEVHKETHRRVRFLTAAKSMKRKAVGFFARCMDSIPVVRAADDAKSGTGRVSLSSNDPCIVLGEGTCFTKDFTPRMQIMLAKSVGSPVAEVVEVISDTKLRVKKEFGGDKGTARIREVCTQSPGGLEFNKLPYVDQHEMYRAVYRCLANGGSVGIFPEGECGSHDRSDLLPFKAGVSIMALGAMANEPNLKVKILPVGLSYFHPHRFRSRAVVEFGTALDVPVEYVEMFKQGDAQKRQAVGRLLDLIYDALKTVTVRAPDFDTLMVIQAVRRLYNTPGQHLTLGQVVELNRRLLEGYEHFKDEQRVQKLKRDVLKYNRLLRDLGLRDHQVPRAKRATWKTLGLLLYRLEALAASQVKLTGKDVLATWKILISLGLAPILYGFYAFVATWLAIRVNAPLKWRIAMPFAIMLALPFMSYAALKFGEAGMDVLKSIRPLIVSLVPGQQRSLDRLKIMRMELANQVADVINEFGPKLYEDFDLHRITIPSSSVPPSSGTPGIWRRKSGAGAVDAPGLGLTHPMTWLDERLFGWSRSAKRGTSAWLGHADPSSHTASPDNSDDEDGGDYDNVLGLVQGKSSTGYGRSRQSSYADLHKLRTRNVPPQPQPASSTSTSAMSSPIVVESETEGETHDSPLRHRVRKPSLSDRIPVKRIAAVDRHEQFPEATSDLNQEAEQRKGL